LRGKRDGRGSVPKKDVKGSWETERGPLGGKGRGFQNGLSAGAGKPACNGKKEEKGAGLFLGKKRGPGIRG